MSESKIEEIICALWLIAALLAWMIGFKLFAVVLGIKAAGDFLCANYYARKEIKEELNNNNGNT